MTTLVCLRCDRTAEADEAATAGATCDRCGVPVYVVARPERKLPSSARLGDPVPDAIAPSGPAPSDPAPRVRGSRAPRTTAFVVVAVVMAISLAASSSVLRSGGRDVPPTSGRLVYEGIGADGDRRLWELDLASGAVRRGPTPGHLVELVRVPRGRRSALGYTRENADGTFEAYVAPGTSALASPHRVIAGDLVSWDASGTSVVAARRGVVDGGCHRGVSIAVADLDLAERQRVFFDRRSCADLVAVGRSGVRTTVSVERGGRIGTFSAGPRTLHPEVAGHVLVAASPQGDLLVTPAAASAFPGIAPLRSRGSASAPVARPVGATVLYWPGRGGPAPLGDAGDIVADRVLAWSADGSTALAVGEVNAVPSVFVTTAVPAAREVARVIAPVSGVVTGGALGSDGAAYVAMDGRILRSQGGAAAALDVPGDAPTPVGPMAWLP
jgi:DNA-directed RNA polymerase subunit RPC12/RpoP